jgi:hypothetical protein
MSDDSMNGQSRSVAGLMHGLAAATARRRRFIDAGGESLAGLLFLLSSISSPICSVFLLSFPLMFFQRASLLFLISTGPVTWHGLGRLVALRRHGLIKVVVIGGRARW